MRSAGAILLSDRPDRAVFIQPEEIAAFREMTALILKAPTVSGPPLIIEALTDFAVKLDVPEMVADVTTPIEVRLSSVDEQILTLLRHQIALRAKLPLRIRRTCVTCGDTKIENPNMIVKSKLMENTGSVAGAVLETVGLIAEGHHIRAVIKVMGSVSTIVGKNQEDIPACHECQGQEFDTPAVTYCPHCRKLRAETVLVECVDCGASFIDSETLPEGWQERPAAYAAFRLAANAELFAQSAARFEGKLNTDQRRYLESTFTADDVLVAMCRCGRPGEQMRAVALLLTTRQLVWARQLRTGSNTGGWLPWSSVTAIHLSGMSADARVVVEAADTSLTFTGFKGTGVTFDDRAMFFHPDGVARLMAELSGVEVTRDPIPHWPAAAEIAPPVPVSGVPVSGVPVSGVPVSGVPVSGGPVSPASTSPAPFSAESPVFVPVALPIPVPSAVTPAAAPPAPVPPVSAPPVSASPRSVEAGSLPPVAEPPAPVELTGPGAVPTTWTPPAETTSPGAEQTPTSQVSSATSPEDLTSPVVAPPAAGSDQIGSPESVAAPAPADTPQEWASPAGSTSVSDQAPSENPFPRATPVEVPPTVVASGPMPSIPSVSPPGISSGSSSPLVQSWANVPPPGPGAPAYGPPSGMSAGPVPTGPTSGPMPQVPPTVQGPSGQIPPVQPTGEIPAQSIYPTSPVGPAGYPAPYPQVPQLDFSSAEPPPAPATAGWYADPFGVYRYRWWDGITWTKMFYR